MLFKNIPAVNVSSIKDLLAKRKKKGFETFFRIISVRELMVDFELRINLPMLNWEYLGSKETRQGGMIFNGNVPAQYHNDGMFCEHCQTNRNRKHVVIVRQKQTKEIRQIGKTCLQEYLGSEYRGFTQLLKTFDELGKIIDGIGVDKRNATQRYYNVDKVLQFAQTDILARGYHKASDPRSTKNAVLCANYDTDLTSQQQKEVAQMKKYLYTLTDNNNDFIQNLQTICKEEYIPKRLVGIVCYLPELYRKAQNSKNSKYLGRIGEKITVSVVSASRYCYDTDWGTMNVYKMFDNFGNCVVWKTLKDLDYSKPFVIEGKVKELSEYKGKEETILTRCRIV